MIKQFDIQEAIKDVLSDDTSFNANTLVLLGKQFTFEIDEEERMSVDKLPIFIIHKSFSLNSSDDVDAYAIQFNLGANIGVREDNHYPSIKHLEILAHQAIELADTAVCKLGLVRTSVKQFVTEIGSADDIEWIVSIGYMTQSDKFI